MKAPIRLGVAGATGAVGLEMLRVLEERAFPLERLRPMASGRAESRSVRFAGRDLAVEALSRANLEGLDTVLFATGPAVSLEFVPAAAASGAVAGALTDIGVNDKFMKELSGGIGEGEAVLFVLVKKVTGDKVLAGLEGVGGRILQTSLDHTREDRLRKALEGHVASEAPEAPATS